MASKYTAVLYVHGIGNPARNASLSTFLDYFDLYGQTQSKEGLGKPRNFSYRTAVTDDDEVVHYVEFKRIVTKAGQARVAKTIRVYEAYWVPEAESRYSLVYVLLWLLMRALSPFRLAFSTWRNFPAFRLSCLHSLAATRSVNKIEKLERAFRDFENWENRRQFPKGSFSEFKAFLGTLRQTRGTTSDDLISLADEWRCHTRRTIWEKIITVVGTVSGIFLAAAIQAYLCYGTWRYAAIGFPSAMAQAYLAITAITLVVSFCVIKAAKEYAYDVLTWTINSEKDQRFQTRERVVGYTRRLINHVASGHDCEEFFIVSHSLGTSIAAEALLQEGQRAKAEEDEGEGKRRLGILGKLVAVFTIGSPIDLIFNFFQTDTTFSHRYNRLREEQRLSIAMPPFRIAGRAGHAKLVNIWSRFDPISSPLTSLRKSISERRDAIVNVEAIPPGIPSPLETHIGYYADPKVMGLIYTSIMSGTNVVASAEPTEIQPALRMYGPWVNLISVALGLIFLAVFALGSSIIASAISFAALVIWLLGIWRWRRNTLLSIQAARGRFLKR
ncbi:hypothetical protein EHS39_26130 [Ensifer sp. MPMI2T]|nr:hypothetical protein EHS39_26130 [Ensifer sp. MPMI2T]